MTGACSGALDPFITLVTERPEYHLNDSVWAFYTLGNFGPTVWVDAYAAVQMPGDPNLYSLFDFSTTLTPISLDLQQGTYVAPTQLLDYPILNPLPGGQYTIYAALCVPGTTYEFIGDITAASFTYE